MRDLDENPYTLEERIKRRLLMEAPVVEASHAEDVAEVEWIEGFLPDDYPRMPYEPTGWHEQGTLVRPTDAARVAAREAEHPTNLLAQTMQQPRPFELVLDEAAVIAKFIQEEK